MFDPNAKCPYVGQPCIGAECCEFVPRHEEIQVWGINVGIQDYFMAFYCWLTGNVYDWEKEHTCVAQICAHCRLGIRSAHRWDKD